MLWTPETSRQAIPAILATTPSAIEMVPRSLPPSSWRRRDSDDRPEDEPPEDVSLRLGTDPPDSSA